jgi:hypothetical protein
MSDGTPLELKQTMLSAILLMRQDPRACLTYIVNTQDLISLAFCAVQELAEHYPQCDDCLQQRIYDLTSEAGT